MELYFKVVTHDYQSINELIPPEFRIKYKIGQEAFPKAPHSKLFVFGNYFEAQAFQGGPNRIILACYVKEPTSPNNYLVPAIFMEEWLKTMKFNRPAYGIPLGTIACDSIIPLFKCSS